MIKIDAGLQAQTQKIESAQRMQQIKEQDVQRKADERSAMQAFKMSQPPRQPGGFPV
jgi:hypothetical protein